MLRLPVSGTPIDVRPPSGADDLLLAEARDVGLQLAVAVAGRMTRAADGGELDWAEMPLTDLDACMLELHLRHFGDLVQAETACPASGCGRRFDVSLCVGDYLEHHRPVRPRGVEHAAEAGWHRLAGSAIEFRPPRARDLCELDGRPGAAASLMARCVRPRDTGPQARRRVQRALGLMAPSLCRDLEMVCPECGVASRVRFDPPAYVLRELRDSALAVYEDVHLLAAAYHWSESAILDLPRDRRERYAERVRAEWRPA